MSNSGLSPKLLNGKFIAIACSAQKSSPLVAGMQAMGASVLPLHVIDIQEVEDKAPLDEALDAIGKYDWILFTSTYAVQFFVRRLTERGINLAELPQLKVCAVGPGTAAFLASCGIKTALVPDEYVAEGIFRALEDYHGGLSGLAGLRILLPRAMEARDVLPRELSSAGALVDIVPCYQNTPGEIGATALHAFRTRHLDLLVFTSSSAVHHFIALIGKVDALQILRGTPVAVLGPITARTVESLGIKVAVIPDQNSVPALVAAIGAWGEKNIPPQR
jgi:uroporphyrinogen III methyltransferase/synthase